MVETSTLVAEVAKVAAITKHVTQFRPRPAPEEEKEKVRVIRPQAGPQERFLSSPADIVIFGGAAGGGKTMGLMLEPLRHIGNPGFGAVIFRKTFPQIEREGGMWDQSLEIYPHVGGRPQKSGMAWMFPSGAKVSFAHIVEQGVEDWKGAQIPLICFDQLEEHAERTFFYLMSRNRSTCGVRPYVRATVNPDPDTWVGEFIKWWIDQDTGFPIESRGGELRWFVRDGTKLVWADTAQELRTQFGIEPKSVTFIPSKLSDNPILMEKDPGYRSNLLALDYVDQQRLLHGNWKVRAEAGKVFNRAWFEIVDAVPSGGEEGTGWDLAATEQEIVGGRKNDPDYTASTTMRRINGTYYVMDAFQVRVGPARTDELMLQTARDRRNICKRDGIEYRVRWEREPGASGKRDNMRLVQMFTGFDARGMRPQGDKVVRAKPVAAQALVGNVKLLRGDWNEEFLRHLHAFPDGAHDDLTDSLSVVFNDLSMFNWGEPQKEEETQ